MLSLYLLFDNTLFSFSRYGDIRDDCLNVIQPFWTQFRPPEEINSLLFVWPFLYTFDRLLIKAVDQIKRSERHIQIFFLLKYLVQRKKFIYKLHLDKLQKR